MRFPLSLFRSRARGTPSARHFQIEPLEVRALLAIDLQVLDFSAPATGVVGNGDQLVLSWTVQNNGDEATTAGFWFDSIYVSDDPLYDFADTFIEFVVAGETPLGPGESYTIEKLITLPNIASGNRYLILNVDETNEQPEANDADNFGNSAITLTTPDVDLTIASFTSPVNQAVAGQPFLLNWSIENTGSDFASAGRMDRIYISTDDFFDFGDESIYADFRGDGVAPFAGVSGSALVTIPETYEPGTYYLFVGIDDFNEQFETNDFNNGTVLPIEVINHGPDFAVDLLETDGLLTPGTIEDVTYTVTNGSGTDAEVPFFVGFYLSVDGTLSDDDLFVGADDVSSELPLDTFFTRVIGLNIPAGLPGNAYLIAVADITYNVTELNEFNNTLATAVTIDEPAVVDLAVSDLQAPTSVLLGSTVEVSYNVTNNGSATLASTWSDRFYLSDDAILDEFDVQVDPQDYEFTLGLGVNETELVQRSITFQNATLATGKYLLVEVGRGLDEEDKTNNVAAFQLDIVGADLDVTASSAPTSASVNQFINIAWTVENIGTAAIAGSWQDRIYFSPDAVLSQFDTVPHIEFVNRAIPLAPGESYSFNRSINVPDIAAGTYYVFVRTMATGTQDIDAANNVELIGTIEIGKPDLIVSDFDAPTIAAAGSTISVTYTVTNDSDNAMGSPSITDRFMLSDDPVLSIDDEFLSLVFISSDTLPLPAHGSYERTVNLQLPAGSHGSKYLVFRTNTFIGEQGEISHANNDHVHSIEIVASDLVVDSLIVPPGGITFGTPFDVTYTVRNNGTGPTNQLSWFDRIALTSADVSVSIIVSDVLITLDEPLAAGATYTRTVTANVLPIAAAGDYRLGVAADILDDMVEVDEHNNVILSDLFPVILPPLPNLEITSALVPVEGIAGQQLALTWTVTNLGTAAAVGPWNDRVTLDGPQFVDVGLFSFIGTLQPGESVTRTELIDIPEFEGGYVVTIHTDFENDVLEGPDETNTYNSGLINVIAPPLPDLTITNIVEPADGVFSGSTVPITFTVTNVGAGATLVPAWTDFVFLSTNPNFVYPDPLSDDLEIINQQNELISRPNLSYLEPGQSYTQTVDVTIPLAAAGTWYVYVFPSGLGEFYSVPVTLRETDRTNNLTRSDGFQVNLTPPPDLVLSQAIAPLQSFSGQPVNVQWTTINNGSGATVATVWVDRIYLSLDDTLDPTDLLLQTNTAQTDFVHLGRLEPGQSYTGSATVVLPNGISGAYNLLVVTDAQNAVFEAGVEANNVGLRTTLVNLTPPPDLVADSISIQPTSLAGHGVEVTYVVTNRGNTDTPTANSLDRIYLSSDPVLDPSDHLLSEVWAFTGVLQVDQSYSRTRNVTLPADLEGPYYLIVLANANDTIFELDRENNVVAAQTYISNVPPNLTAINVHAVSTLETGKVATIEWTVLNNGSGDTATGRWIDKVYLSTNGTNSDGILLGYFVHNGVLGPTESYTQRVGVEIPYGVPEFSGIYVVTDAQVTGLEASLQLPPTGPNGSVYEGAAENDNVSALNPFFITLNTPDLDVTHLEFSPGGTESGSMVEVSWLVQNHGGRTNSDHWIDDVYLSLDPNLSADDIFLGSQFHSGALAQGESYAASLFVRLPDTLTTGDYYIILQVDRTLPKSVHDPLVNLVYEDFSEANNIAAGLIEIAAAVVPDLVVSDVQIPSTPIAGRTLEVSWTVTNTGVSTGDRNWRDAVYLSLDQFLDPTTDRFLGYRNHAGGLLSSQQYTANSSFTIPAGLTGPYYVFVRTDAGNAIYERGNEANNSTNYPYSLLIQLGQPVDFTVGLIEVPVTATAGATATIGYTITNNVNLPVPGGWTDSIYLSADNVWDASDVLFAQVPHPGDLAAGESYSQLVNKTLPILAPGNYHVIIRTDVYNTVAETNETNNLGVSLDVAAVGATEIDLGVPRVDALFAGGFQLYRVEVPAGETLRFSWDSAFNSASTELYVRYGTPPTRNNFDLQSTLHFQADHEIFVPTSKAGTYYVMVHANSGNASGTVLVESLPFSVVAASPGQIGNAGNATIEITGALFTRGTTFELHLAAGPIIEAQANYIESAAKAYATFDLKGLPVGHYDLVARASNGAIATIASAVEVVESLVGGQLTAGMSVPDFTLAGAVGNFFLTYSNSGNNDIFAPLLTVSSPTGNYFGDTGLWNGPGEDEVIYGAVGKGPAGILRPGQSVTIPFVFQATNVFAEKYAFALSYHDGDSTTPIDWDWIEQLIDPWVATADNYPQVFARLQAEVGTTMGDYVRFLSRLANLIPPELGGRTNHLDLLSLGIEILSVQDSTSISGKVVADDLEIDLSGNTLQAIDVLTGESIVTTTLNDGSFFFTNMPAGEYRFSYAAAMTSADLTVTLAPDDHASGISVLLTKAASLTGSVRTSAGDLIAEGTVLAYDLETGTMVTGPIVDGTYSLIGLSPGEYTLEIETPGFARYVDGPIEIVGTETIQRDVVLASGATVMAHVVLGDGASIAAPVTFRAEALESIDLMGGVVDLFDAEFLLLDGLSPGDYRLKISLEGYVPYEFDVSLANGQILNLGSVTLQPAASLSGAVRFDDPLSVDDTIFVFLLFEGEIVNSTLPDAVTGEFTFSNLPAGDYEVRVTPILGKGTSQFVQLSAGEDITGLDLATLPGGTIFGQVTDTVTGLPAVGVSVVIYGPTGAFTEIATDSNGQYRFERLAVGVYTVALRVGGVQSRAELEILDLESDPIQANLNFEYAARIRGQLVLPGGLPIEEGTVAFYDESHLIHTAIVQEDGEFQFFVFEPGTYTLQAASPFGSFTPIAASVGQGDDTNVVITAGAFSIAVELSGATTLEGASVTLFAKHATGLQIAGAAIADSSGAVNFVNLVAGDYLVLAITANQGFGSISEFSVSGDEQVALPLQSLHTLTGTVNSSDSQPVAGAAVSVVDRTTGLIRGLSVTDPLGQYRVEGLLTGNYDIVIRKSTYLSSAHSELAIAGDTVLDVSLATSSTRIQGVLVDADGRPIPSAQVQIMDADGLLIGLAVADEQGAFVITTAVGSGLQLVASADGYAPITITDLTAIENDTVVVGTLTLSAVAQALVSAPLLEASIASLVEQQEVETLTTSTAESVSPTGSSSLAEKPSTADESLSFTSNSDSEDPPLDDDAIQEIIDAFERIDVSLPNHGLGKFANYSDPNWVSLFELRLKEYQDLLSRDRIKDPGPPPKCDICQIPYQKLREAIEEQEKMYKAHLILTLKLEDLRNLYLWVLPNELNSQIVVPFVVPFAKFTGVFLNVAVGVLNQFINFANFMNDLDNATTSEEWASKASATGAITVGTAGGAFTAIQSWFQGLAWKYPVLNDLGLAKDLAILNKITFRLGMVSNALNFFGNIFDGNFFSLSRDAATKVHFTEEKIKIVAKQFELSILETKKAKANLDKCNAHAQCDDKHPSPPPGDYSYLWEGENGSRIDPNDILGPDGYGDPRFVAGDSTLDYTVRFENLESATLPVQNLVITSQLDADLDFRTVRFGGFGWGDQSFAFQSDKPFLNERVDLTATLGFHVDVVATIDVETGLATWSLTAIDPATGLEPLDDRIGFLPPNDDAHIGEGFVTYSARPKAGLDTGTVIDAQATIIFDTEAPLDTPVWSNTLDVDVPTSQLDVLPVESDSTTFLLNWTADDVAGGSGLATTTILVSENDGAFRTLCIAAGATRQYLFEGTVGNSYRFFSVAMDNAGNREASPTVADAITTVLINSAPTVVAPIADVNEDEDAADTVLDLSSVFSDIDVGVGGDSLTYTVTGNTNTDLVTTSLEGTTLTLDYAANQHGTATITIRATDLAGEWVEDTFLVTIDSVNDDPTVATPIANVTVDEDAPNTVIDVTSNFADVDIATDADSLTYTVTGNTNAGLVTGSFDGSNLTLDYTANQHGAATITVRATDESGEWVETTFLVTVDSVNDDPTVATPIANVNVDEDAPNTVIDVASNFADVDIATNADSLTYTVTGNTNAGLVTGTFDGANLTLDYAPNQHGSATITIRATDLAGEWIETSFLVTVDSVNDAPTVATPIANVTVDEDAPNTVIDVTSNFADVDIATNADSLTYTVTGNTNAGLVTGSFDGSHLTLDYTANQHGAATIIVRATDESGEWVETSFLVTVNSVNDDPTVAAPIANVTVDEDAPNTVVNVASNFADVDIATSADSLTYTVTGNTNAGLVSTSFDGSNLTLDYLPNQHGTATITVRATDESGEWVETTFLVTVNSVGIELPFTDNFNRADGTSLGNNWVETLGNLGLTSQRVVLYQNTESTAILNDLLVADVNVEAFVDLTGAEVGRSIALMARSQGPGDQNAYWGVYYRSDSGYAAQIYKNIGGVPTALRSVNVPGPAGTMRFEVFGTTLNLYFNDTLVTSVIDDSLLAAGAIGMRQTGGALDNFAAEVAVPPLSENALLPFTDNFNRADNSLFGSVWTERSGDAGVRGNKAGLYANDTSVVTLNGVLQADVSISADIDITSVPAQFSTGLLARYSGPGDSNTYMARMYRSDGGIFAAQIWKNVGGAYTPLRSVIVPSGAGTLRFDVVGDQLELFFNGTLVASTIDSSITGPGQVGMRLAGGTLDNFSASALVPEPTSDAELPFLDNFARPNGSSLGEFWTERAGDLGLQDGELVLMAGETSVATVNGVSADDIEVSAEIDIAAGGNAGLLARYSGPGDANAYMALMQAGTGGSYAAQIWKNIGAGWVNLTHSALATGAGELRFLLEGTHLQLFFDDVLVGDVIDSSITAPGTVGVRQGGGSIDDFTAEVPLNVDGFLSDELFAEDEDWTIDEKFAEIFD